MGRTSRSKGKRGQLEVRDLLLESNWPDAATEGGAQSHGALLPDVDAPGLPWWLEVKASGKPNILAAYRQAHKDAQGKRDREPVAATRLVASTGPRDDVCRLRWLATVDLEYLLSLEAELRERRREAGL